LRHYAYAEHFAAVPSGLAFNTEGTYFALSTNSNNEVRDIEFKINPERNTYFRGSNFMGPALFATDTFSRAGQSKEYLEDWPQPGYGHDPVNDVPQEECPDEFWSRSDKSCHWPREGSHVDMLHGSPLSTGIVHDTANAYYLLDGCGSRDADNNCQFDGHLVMNDFNRDHQEGNGFHGDGVSHRFIDSPFTRVDGIPAGMVKNGDWVYYADTGAGVVRRTNVASGRSVALVASWTGESDKRHHTGHGLQDWSHAHNSPGDGAAPEVVSTWVQDHGDAAAIAAEGDKWIMPQEVLRDYSYIHDTTTDIVIGNDVLEKPSGLATDGTTMYVSDFQTGDIYSFTPDASPATKVANVGHGVTGLAWSPEDSTIYATNMIEDSLVSVRLS